jgi:hypothetical protein
MPCSPDMDAAEHAAIDRAAPGLGERMLFMTAGFVADKAQQFLTRIPGQSIYKPFDLKRLRSTVSSIKYRARARPEQPQRLPAVYETRRASTSFVVPWCA